MKKVILFAMGLFMASLLMAQTPAMFSYQAVVRDATGTVMANKSVSLRISILEGSFDGEVVMRETHPVSTNEFGLVNLRIGNGYPVAGNITEINWGSNQYFLRVELDPTGGSSYIPMGTSQLLSVPYALHAKTVETDQVNDADADPVNEIQELLLNGTLLTLSKGGGTVTLPTSGGGDNWGTQVVVADATLAGNGTSPTPLTVADNGITSRKIQDGAITTPDLEENAVTADKIAPGAVTGSRIAQSGASNGQTLKWNGTTWAPADDLAGGGGLTLPYSGSGSSASPVFEVINSSTGDGIKGIATSAAKTGLVGEAPNQGISGFATALTGAAYGVQGTSASSTGSGVTGYGSSSTGKNFGVRGITASGSGTAIYGLATATSGTTYGVWGESNAAAGWGIYGKGPSGGVYGISPHYSGYGVFGESTADAGWGVYGKGKIAVYGSSIYEDGRGLVGSATGSGLTYGIYGSSTSPEGIGVYGSNTSSTGTTMGVYGRSGSSSGYGVYGEGKTAIYGTTASTTGYGIHAECTATSGYTRGVSSTVYSADGFSGYFAGGKFVVTSSRVGIGTVLPGYQLDVAGTANFLNGLTGVALRCNGSEAIWYNGTYYSWGFGGNYNYFADNVSIGTTATPGYNLVVNGTAAKTGGGSWSNLSDVRLKDLSGNYEKGLKEILSLQPVRFTYKEGNPRELSSEEEQIGFIAQEVQKIFPEAVAECRDGYLDFNMHAVNVAMVNAIRELKAENDLLKERLSRLESLLGAKAEN
jgi:trimeric autotransporter adhesin